MQGLRCRVEALGCSAGFRLKLFFVLGFSGVFDVFGLADLSVLSLVYRLVGTDYVAHAKTSS